MKSEDLMLIGAVAVGVFLMAGRLRPAVAGTVTNPLHRTTNLPLAGLQTLPWNWTISGSQQDKALKAQCGDWAECLGQLA